MRSTTSRPPSFLVGLPDDVAPRRRFPRGAALFRHGDPARHVHVILRGRVVVRLVTPTGEQLAVEVLGPGETVGELAVVAATFTRNGSVIALEPVETRAIPATVFDELLGKVPELAGQVLATLADRVGQMNNRLLEAMFSAATDRVRMWLGEMAELYADGEGPVTVPLTQCELAELAGTTAETVNRVLRREAARGTVTPGRSRIVVIDRSAFGPREPATCDVPEMCLA